jgi:hypothetical protein
MPYSRSRVFPFSESQSVVQAGESRVSIWTLVIPRWRSAVTMSPLMTAVAGHPE